MWVQSEAFFCTVKHVEASQVSKEGKYHVKLFDGRVNRWKVLNVDDYLPCTSWGGNRPSLYFGKINDGKLCMVLLEKAFAKLYGAYGGLRSGWQPIAWFHMTGCDNFFRYHFTYESPMKWEVIDSEGIPVYSDKRRSTKLGVLPAGAHFHEKQRIGSWIQIANATDGPNGWVTYYSKGKRVARRSPTYAPRFYFGHLEVKKATVSA